MRVVSAILGTIPNDTIVRMIGFAEGIAMPYGATHTGCLQEGFLQFLISPLGIDCQGYSPDGSPFLLPVIPEGIVMRRRSDKIAEKLLLTCLAGDDYGQIDPHKTMPESGRFVLGYAHTILRRKGRKLFMQVIACRSGIAYQVLRAEEILIAGLIYILQRSLRVVLTERLAQFANRLLIVVAR